MTDPTPTCDHPLGPGSQGALCHLLPGHDGDVHVGRTPPEGRTPATKAIGWMRRVRRCSEDLGDDGMCDCARAHFEALDEAGKREAELLIRARQAIRESVEVISGGGWTRAKLLADLDAALGEST